MRCHLLSQPLKVIIEGEASEVEVAAVRDVFAEFGIEAEVKAAYLRRSMGLLPWAMMIEVPLCVLAKGFLQAAGADAWRVLRDLVKRLFEERNRSGRPEGAIEIRDLDTHTIVIFSNQVTDEGFETFVRGDFGPGGDYIWDIEAGAWKRAL